MTQAEGPVFVMSGGYTWTPLHWQLHDRWLRGFGTPINRGHPARGFNYSAEALDIYRSCGDADAIVFLGASMGAQVGLAFIELLQQQGELSRLKAFVAICGYTGPDSVAGISPRLWPLLRWPLSFPWLNLKLMEKGERDVPPPPLENLDRTFLNQVRRAEASCPNALRRAQARAMWHTESPLPQCLGDLPVSQIVTPDDQVLNTDVIRDAWNMAARVITTITAKPRTVRHCSLTEHPGTWADLIAQALSPHGVVVDPLRINRWVTRTS